MDTGAWLLILFWIALPVSLFLILRSYTRRAAKRSDQARVEYAAWFADYERWWTPQAQLASNPATPPKVLRAKAVEAFPDDPTLRTGFVEILRLLVNNPATPPELQGGIMARIAAEESALRMDARLTSLQRDLQAVAKKGGGGFAVGGAVSFPLD